MYRAVRKVFSQLSFHFGGQIQKSSLGNNKVLKNILQDRKGFTRVKQESRLQEIPRDRDLAVYCRTGARSASAAKILMNKGYNRIFNLEGGIVSWPYEVEASQQ